MDFSLFFSPHGNAKCSMMTPRILHIGEHISDFATLLVLFQENEEIINLKTECRQNLILIVQFSIFDFVATLFEY